MVSTRTKLLIEVINCIDPSRINDFDLFHRLLDGRFSINISKTQEHLLSFAPKNVVHFLLALKKDISADLGEFSSLHEIDSLETFVNSSFSRDFNKSIENTKSQADLPSPVQLAKPSPVYEYYNKPDEDLIQDLILVLQGLDGKGIKFTANGFYIDIQQKGPRLLIKNLVMLGWYYKALKSIKSTNLVGQSLASFINNELIDYHQLLVLFSKNKLTVHKMIVWSSQPYIKLKLLYDIMNNTRNKTSAEILSIIYDYTLRGNLTIKAYSQKCLAQVRKVYDNMITNWINKGVLSDPYNEFFIQKTNDDAWNNMFIMNDAPNYMEITECKKIYMTGRNIYFTQQPINEKSLDQSFTKSGRLVMEKLRADGLQMHLHNLFDYLLLQKTDFGQILVDNLIDTYSVGSVHKFHLTRALEDVLDALEISSTILKYLDVKILPQVGLEYFCLDYSVDGSSSLVITPSDIEKYQALFGYFFKIAILNNKIMKKWKDSKRTKNNLQMRSLVTFISSFNFFIGSSVGFLFKEMLKRNNVMDNVIEAHSKYLVEVERLVGIVDMDWLSSCIDHWDFYAFKNEVQVIMEKLEQRRDDCSMIFALQVNFNNSYRDFEII